MATHFIPEAVVLVVHADLLRRYGGRPGIRDRSLLASALTQPKMTAGGSFLHRTIFDKAAADGYHLCQNHPCIDGNKPVAFVVMDMFLQRNGWELRASERDAYATMIALASGKLTKSALAARLKEQSRQTSG
jgi:death-on-curing protein